MLTGVPDCAQIDGRTPPDEVAGFWDASNELNGIASRTGIILLYEKTDLIILGWRTKVALKDDKMRKAKKKKVTKKRTRASASEPSSDSHGSVASAVHARPQASPNQRPRAAEVSCCPGCSTADDQQDETRHPTWKSIQSIK